MDTMPVSTSFVGCCSIAVPRSFILGIIVQRKDIANAALSEDVHAIAVSSYQGGHNEFFPYLRQCIDAGGGKHIKIFGGGGGVITLKEIQALQAQGIEKIFSPEDGQNLGLDGIIGYMLQASDYSLLSLPNQESLARKLTRLEASETVNLSASPNNHLPILGITGTGGAGKSSLIDELLLRWQVDYPDRKIAVICIDPQQIKDWWRIARRSFTDECRS